MAVDREERLAQLKEERERRLAEAAKARAEADPMRNPTVRPEAEQDDPNMVKYYGWIGGASSGRWKLYQTPIDSPQASSAETRSQGGATQATFNSAVGANTLKTTSNPPSTDGNNIATGNLPAGFTAGSFPAGLEKLFGSSAGYLGYRIVTNSDGSQQLQVATGPGSYQTFGARFTTDASGNYISFVSSKPNASNAATDGSGSTDGASSTKGLTQADVDAAITKALATQQAKFDALAAQQKAEADAAKLALKVKAKDKLTTMLAGYGLEGLAGFIDRRIMADVSEEQVMLELYDQPEYQRRFPGMAALRKAGRTITESEYMKNENAMVQTARFFDIPKGFYDTPDDFGDLIGKEVSPKEFQDRLQVGQDLARSLNPAVKQQLIDFYGVGEGDLTAFVLDAERALPLIQKQAKAAQFVGIGRAAGFTLGGITAQQAENIAGTESYAKLSEAELAKALGSAGQLRRTQQRLAQLEGVTYNEQEALQAVIEGSPEALLASQQRAQREAARFSARGGVTGSTLRSTTTI
jgi:hypothetical protein